MLSAFYVPGRHRFHTSQCSCTIFISHYYHLSLAVFTFLTRIDRHFPHVWTTQKQTKKPMFDRPSSHSPLGVRILPYMEQVELSNLYGVENGTWGVPMRLSKSRRCRPAECATRLAVSCNVASPDSPDITPTHTGSGTCSRKRREKRWSSYQHVSRLYKSPTRRVNTDTRNRDQNGNSLASIGTRPGSGSDGPTHYSI